MTTLPQHTQKMREKMNEAYKKHLPLLYREELEQVIDETVKETLAWAEEQIEEAMSENGNSMLVAKRRIITGSMKYIGSSPISATGSSGRSISLWIGYGMRCSSRMILGCKPLFCVL